MSNTFEIKEKGSSQGQTETKEDGYDAHTPFLDYHIYCPFLDLVASGEYHGETKTQQEICMAKLPNPEKQMIISPEKEGATSHCIFENRSVMSQIVFDWLDKIFKKS